MDVMAIIGIVLALVGLPGAFVDEDALAMFERVQRHLGQDVVVVDATGVVLEGRVLAASATGLDLGFGQHVRHLDATEVARVDRQRDSPIDGWIKGLIIGALVGSLSGNGRWTLALMAGYGGLGLALDAGQQSREPIYRARDPKMVKIRAAIRW